jgi:hypothetical protein
MPPSRLSCLGDRVYGHGLSVHAAYRWRLQLLQGIVPGFVVNGARSTRACDAMTSRRCNSRNLVPEAGFEPARRNGSRF